MSTQRLFIPGSKWLYFKIYTGCKSADEILVDYLFPFLTDLKEKNIVKDYFYIRYTDPKFHIRLRIYIKDILDYGIVFQEFSRIFTPCMDKKLVWNIQCDTYKRELERYGEVYMTEVEKVFCIDSQSIMQLIQLIEKNATPNEDRWKLSLLLLDDLLSAFGLSLKEKSLYLKQMSEVFKIEFGFISSISTKQLNDKFRFYRKMVNKVMSHEDIYLDKYKDILNSRKNEITSVVSAIDPKFDYKLNLIKSLVHMTMNRFFRSKNRLFELVIYDFMNRYYESKIARLKHS